MSVFSRRQLCNTRLPSTQVDGLDHCWIGGRSGGFATCVKRPGDVSTTDRAFAYWSSL